MIKLTNATKSLTNTLMTVALVMSATSTNVYADKLFAKLKNSVVKNDGDIQLPQDYRKNWSHLGSWLIADEKAPGHGFHDVYTQPKAVDYYHENGSFADGTVLVKEVRAVKEGAQTTGHAQWAGDTNIWFVMVKDTKGRFSDSEKHGQHWAEGWGWALFESKDPTTNVSKSFEETCKGCHVPAQATDWVFTNGYPTLNEK